MLSLRRGVFRSVRAHDRQQHAHAELANLSTNLRLEITPHVFNPLHRDGEKIAARFVN